MAIHLVSGGCGFVGRNLIRRLLKTTDDTLFVIDDLSSGTAPEEWLDDGSYNIKADLRIYSRGRFILHQADFRSFLSRMIADQNYINSKYNFNFEKFSDVYHFAAIVGGRLKIDGDPMVVALDLSIDAEFFYWVCTYKPGRVLYPSSSAAYPISMQTDSSAIALKETDIQFDKNLGQPDMTYGWSKLTGEYLAQIAAQYYGVSVACVRPFSGYGEDQDLTYPIPALAARAARKEDPFEVWGSGNQGRDFVHIDDCIDCILMAMDKIHDGSAINIGSGKLTSFLDIIHLFCTFAGYQPSIKPLLDKPVGVHSRYADMTYVKKKYKWEPKISVEEGMRRVYDAAVKRMEKS
ncbi:MAG: NAD-dependent epimerase/dehydratase family protein [Chitinophagales bacterium]|nr:NAD-dependent epimerase/dehydratase family protein [Chitinophagales bacterium]